MNHQFTSQLARDIFSLATETMQEQLRGANLGVPPFTPDSDWDRWAEARSQEKPCVLPVGDPLAIKHELDQLERPRFVGRPHEL